MGATEKDDADLQRILMRYAEWYAARYVPSAERLHHRVTRRAARAKDEGNPSENALRIVDAVCRDVAERGFVADDLLAGGVTRSMLRRGKSRRQIQNALLKKGIGTPDIDAALQTVERDDERDAALLYAKRRRLGAHRPTPPDRAQFAKDLQKMVRNGFPFDTARDVLTKTEEEAH